MNILLVEDESRVADFISRGLRGDGFTVTVANDGETALEFLKQNKFDVVILDLMLPGISGQDVCRKMRAKKDLTPVLMLSALDETDDRISGLQIGADDYLPKPFEFDELVARLNALIRRNKYNQNDTADDKKIISSGTISYDRESYVVTVEGRQIDLTDKERALLALFLTNPNKVLARERILNSVWGADSDPLTNVVDVYVGRLRNKLGLSKNQIKNIRSVGYRYSDISDENCD